MAIKCLVCGKLIFPNLVDARPDTFTICNDHEEITDAQHDCFEKILNESLNEGRPKDKWFWHKIDKFKKDDQPSQPLWDENYVKVDI